MSIFDFAKGLLPRIDRNTVSEDLRVTEKEAVNMVIPSYAAASTYFKLNKLASVEAKELTSIFYRNFALPKKPVKAPNLVMELERLMKPLHENIVQLQSLIDEKLDRDILRDGLTVKSAFLLRSASNLSMVTRYSLALLNYLYTAEAKHHDVTLDPSLEISPAEMKYVEKNFLRFVRLISEYAQPAQDFKNVVLGLPEMYLTKEAEIAARASYEKTSDPFESLGVSGFIGNPIYRVRLVIAKWQNDRYDSAKAKKQQLELRLLYLQMQKDEKQDPGVVKEIERLQSRIESYDRYLREVEDAIEEK